MNLPALLGRDPAFRAAVALARKAAPERSPVLIVGPTGSGKSHLAKCLHAWGAHPRAPFLEWQAAGAPESLLEAELFGVRPGTATGVDGRAGIFEAAGLGTLCLAGIENLRLPQQAALLRILERQLFERLGGGLPLRCAARIVAHFQRSPESLVEQGLLREDLLYRLDVIRIELPPLARRGRDIETLAGHFLKAACKKRGTETPALSPELMAALLRHRWPGNVRELALKMEALALAPRPILTENDLPSSFWLGPDPVEEALGRAMTLAELREAYIWQVLGRVGGNRTLASQWLGISRKALWEHLRRHQS